MRNIFYSFMVGLLVGGGSVALLNKSTPAQATMTVSSSNPYTKITEQSLEVKSKRTLVKVITSFKLNNKEFITNTITINKRNLQFKHSIYAQSGYFINSQLVFLDLGYSYKYFLISTKVGYSFRLQEIDYGFGIGGKWSW